MTLTDKCIKAGYKVLGLIQINPDRANLEANLKNGELGFYTGYDGESCYAWYHDNSNNVCVNVDTLEIVPEADIAKCFYCEF